MMPGQQAITWMVEDGGGAETAWVTIGDGWLAARGRAMGLTPEPYWLTYELDTAALDGGDGYVTRRLTVEVDTAAGRSRLDLRRGDGGAWTANGQPVAAVAGALDCDLGRSPLTNTMPILRHRLHTGAGRQGFAMAWVSVPDLAVHRSEQSYEHLRRGDGGAVVRFESDGGAFVRDLVVDADGLLVDYPSLARRVTAT
jgi:uncharacterized protein